MVSQRETIKGEGLACMREAHAIAKRLIDAFKIIDFNKPLYYAFFGSVFDLLRFDCPMLLTYCKDFNNPKGAYCSTFLTCLPFLLAFKIEDTTKKSIGN